MGVNTAGGVDVAIGGVDSSLNHDLAWYQAESYISLGEVEDGGQFGDESSAIPFTALKDARTKKFKGPRDAGTMAIVCGVDSTDEGQDAMVAAEATKFDYSFRVIFNDAITLSGLGTHSYFSGKVMSKRKNIGNASNVVRYTFNVGINTAIQEVAPS
jgi:hypothetical protein